MVSIGGVEVDHLSLWHDKAGNAVSQPLAGVTDPETALTIPDFNSPSGRELFQTNKILPEPCDFISEDLHDCSVIRPSSTSNSGAAAPIKSFIGDQLFLGQSREFLETIMALAAAADAARRES